MSAQGKSRNGLLMSGLFGTIGAVVAVAVTTVIGDAISGPLMVTSPGASAPEEVGLAAAIPSAVIGGIAGLALAALCKRFIPNPRAAFVGMSVVGLIVFGVFSFSAAEDVATGVWLNVMHVAAAVPIVGLLVGSLQPTATSAPERSASAERTPATL